MKTTHVLACSALSIGVAIAAGADQEACIPNKLLSKLCEGN
jgi:hypothetical protein